jgi:SAM-dependent methyltransferase
MGDMQRQHQHEPTSGKDEWNQRYSGDGDTSIWSGEPNGSLVAEVATMEPGRAIDLGCGEGGDAIWLAARGWDVTGIDISSVAIERAARAAEIAGVEVTWVCGDFLEELPESESFDLVTTHYPAILKVDEERAIAALTAGVTPGGTLLMVWHANPDPEHARAHGFDLDDYVDPSDVATKLGSEWTIEVNEVRPRASNQSDQSPHSEDALLKAKKSG